MTFVAAAVVGPAAGTTTLKAPGALRNSSLARCASFKFKRPAAKFNIGQRGEEVAMTREMVIVGERLPLLEPLLA